MDQRWDWKLLRSMQWVHGWNLRSSCIPTIRYMHGRLGFLVHAVENESLSRNIQLSSYMRRRLD